MKKLAIPKFLSFFLSLPWLGRNDKEAVFWPRFYTLLFQWLLSPAISTRDRCRSCRRWARGERKRDFNCIKVRFKNLQLNCFDWTGDGHTDKLLMVSLWNMLQIIYWEKNSEDRQFAAGGCSIYRMDMRIQRDFYWRDRTVSHEQVTGDG